MIALAVAPTTVLAQGNILGQLMAADTRMPVGGAVVSLSGWPESAQSDIDGRFAILAVAEGTHSLLVRRIGYLPATIAGIEVEGDTTIVIVAELVPALTPLDSVLVSSHIGRLRRMGAPPRAVLSRRDIASAPQIAADAFRALARVPGVSSSDLSAGFRVRGAPNREVLLLFDGMELYEPFHLKDFDGALSIIDPAILGGASLSTGGFGARYGGHLAGVLELSSENVPESRAITSLGASVTGLSAMRRTPFAGGRGDWLVSARRSLLGAALSITGDAARLSPRYYDAYSRLRYRPTEHDEIALSVLRADDDLSYEAEDRTTLSSSYGSTYAWINWRAAPSPRITARSVISFARLDWKRDGSDEYRSQPTLHVADRRSFEALSLQQDISFAAARWIDIDAGAELRRLTSRYDYGRWQLRPRIRARRWVKGSDITSVLLSPERTTVGFYLSQRLRPIPALVIEAGARYDRQSNPRQSTTDPRASLVYQLDEQTSVHAAWGRYSQPQLPYELQVQDGIGRLAHSERAEHLVVGAERHYSSGFTVSAEAYQRRLLRINPRYINLESSLDAFPEAAVDRVLISPTDGYARGVELSAALERRRVRWSASYALAYTRDVVNGRAVPRAFAQRHSLNLDLSVRLASGWRVSAAWQLHSGWPVTPITFGVDSLRDGTHHVHASYGRLNSGRLPPYHRLDLRVTNERNIGSGRLSLYLDVFNVYNRDNPRGLGYTVADWNAAQAVVRSNPMTQLPLLPTLGARWVF